jgi:hypothetical protein
MTQNDTSFRMSVFWAPWEYDIESQYFQIHTMKRVVQRFHKMNERLLLAKNSEILPT